MLKGKKNRKEKREFYNSTSSRCANDGEKGDLGRREKGRGSL